MLLDDLLATNISESLQGHEEPNISIGNLVSNEETYVTLGVVVFKSALEVSEMLGSNVGEEIVGLGGLIGFIGPSGLPDGGQQILNAFEEHVDSNGLVHVAAVEAITPCDVAGDACALHNVHTPGFFVLRDLTESEFVSMLALVVVPVVSGRIAVGDGLVVVIHSRYLQQQPRDLSLASKMEINECGFRYVSHIDEESFH